MSAGDGGSEDTPGTHFSVEIQPVLPERFSRLGELANDLYYSWNGTVRGLFRHLDNDCWNACAHNPRVFLRRLRQRRLDEAARDPILLAEYRHVLAAYDTYREERPTTSIDAWLDPEADLVAYFSAEFGFHESMPIYAGGLGILAADYCKAMSNLWVPFVGVGLLYRQGYFSQRIDCDGSQHAVYPSTDPRDLPVTPVADEGGGELRVSVDLPGRALQLKVWCVKVGQIRLYLLDSDVPENSEQDRRITAQLYGGDGHMRLQQELVLGIGGVRALRALGLRPTVWHINEGHAAFLVLERCREHVAQGLDFGSALELAAANTAFTTHTPVAAGHDVFPVDDIRDYFGTFIDELQIEPERLFALGSVPEQPAAFSMTSLALRGSRFRNGVSRIHGRVASRMSAYVWPELQPAENPMDYVTNGADVDTYLAQPWVALFEMYMGGGWRAKMTDRDFWHRFIDDIPDHVFLSVRQILKVSMLEDVRRRALLQYRRCAATRAIADRLTVNLNAANKGTLVIGFARRFATYKRATLLFHDLERLARLINDPQRPVLLVFAGKAHPNDLPGQQLLRRIFEISQRPEFQGRLILLENYNLSMTRDLLPGVDVWLNNPEYPLEACGTSGMKAAINGAVNLSVLDGWWDEAWDGDNGWGLEPYLELDPRQRERQEARELLDTLEYQVIPCYYQHNEEGEPEAWVKRSKASMKTVLPAFNTIRMAKDYLRQSYAPAARGGRRLAQDDAAGARELAAWKAGIERGWPGVRAKLLRPLPETITAGEPLSLDVEVELNGLRSEDLVVECLVGHRDEDGAFVASDHVPFRLVGDGSEGCAHYHCDLFEADDTCSAGGLQQFRVRLYPWHRLLSHPLECGRMRWL
ncbi:MAG TPA: alpha-glucan family phosphorylase [Gammaproteobacteria bacterium]|nr:alpha-glucan family phosphorylase [Gammaproteobacteria bacterium]